MSNLTKTIIEKKSFKKGKGAYFLTKREISRFYSGITVNSLGHAHPKLVKVISQQSKKLWHVSNLLQFEGE